MSMNDTQRAEQIAGIRALADWFEQHPDVPPALDGHCVLAADDATGEAEINRIAAAAGGYVTRSDDHCIETSVRITSGTTYRAFYVRSQSMAEYDALNSYSGSVRAEVTA